MATVFPSVAPALAAAAGIGSLVHGVQSEGRGVVDTAVSTQPDEHLLRKREESYAELLRSAFGVLASATVLATLKQPRLPNIYFIQQARFALRTMQTESMALYYALSDVHLYGTNSASGKGTELALAVYTEVGSFAQAGKLGSNEVVAAIARSSVKIQSFAVAFRHVARTELGIQSITNDPVRIPYEGPAT